MGESCAWVSSSPYVRLTVCPRAVYSESIIDEICSIAGKWRIGVVLICEVGYQRGWQVDNRRGPNEDAKSESK